MTIKSFRHKDLLLIVPVFALLLLLILGQSTTSTSYITESIRLLVFIFVPGYYLASMLGKIIGLRLDEILVINIMISMAFCTLVSVYLSFPLFHITYSSFTIGLFIITFISGLLCLPYLLGDDGLIENVNYLNIIKRLTYLLVSFLLGFLLVIKVIPVSYWRGWDPWINLPVTQIILEEGLNPYELIRTGMGNLGISGFYYFLTSVRVFTGLDCYTLTRFGGPILAGLASMITYMIIKRIEGVVTGLFASFFLCLNPFFITRFSMTIRENFAYIYFLALLFLLFIGKKNQQKNFSLRLFYIFSIGLLSSITLISHSLVTLIYYGIILIKCRYNIF